MMVLAVFQHVLNRTAKGIIKGVKLQESIYVKYKSNCVVVSKGIMTVLNAHASEFGVLPEVTRNNRI